MALSRIGEQPINSLTEDLTAARACNRAYQLVVDEVIEGRDWFCARAQAILAASTVAPVYGWSYKYPLPASPYCIRLIEVVNSIGIPLEYKLMGRDILSNYGDGLYIMYAKRITNVVELNPLLAQSISLRLAHWIEPLFGDSITRRKSIMDELGIILLQAKQSGAMQDYADEEVENDSTSGNAEWIKYGR